MNDTGQTLDVEPPDDEAVLHEPEGRLRDREDEDSSRVSFVELFFDLVFVFALTQLAAYVVDNVTPEGLVRAGVLAVAVWWLWINTTWVTNRLDPDGSLVRALMFAMMGTSLVLSAALPRAFEDRAPAFAAAYVLIQVGRSLFAAWAVGQEAGRGEARSFLRQGVWFVGSGALWVGGAFAEADARILLWSLALAVELLVPWAGFPVPGLGRSTVRDWDVEGEHLSERCGLFVIIALGESLLVTGARVAEREWDAAVLAAAAAGVLGTLAMWWVYFDTGAKRGTRALEGERHQGRLARVAYTYIHLPIVAGIVLAAVGDKKLIDDPLGPVGWPAALTILGGPALFLLGNFLFKDATSRRWPLSHVAGLAALALGVLVGEWLNILGIAALSVVVLVGVAALERGLLRSPAAAEQGLK